MMYVKMFWLLRFYAYIYNILIALTMGLASCTKEGPVGPAGTAGTDGNANVKTIILDNLDWNGGSSISVTIPELTPKNLAEDAILEYAYFGTAIYNIPGPALNGDFILRTFFNTGLKSYRVRAMEWDGTTHASPDSIHQIKLVIIESTSTASAIKQLDDAGIDVKDYKAVENFFGIE